VVLTVLSSFLRQTCLVFTNVTSALEVFLKCYALYKSTFYLLTYLLPETGFAELADRDNLG